MATRLTPFARLLITLLIVGGVGFGVWYFLNKTKTGQEVVNNASTENNNSANPTAAPANIDRGDADLVVQIFTWGGYAPGLYFNNGLNPSDNSRYFKEYGLKVKFVLIDDFNASREAWKADQVNMIGSTIDALPTEMEGLGSFNPVTVMQTDWSRGGDVIVATRNIKTLNDLRGKKVAYTPSTPSMSFLIKSLDAAGLSLNDIKAEEMGDNIKAAEAFKAGAVDAAVVWSPDDQGCIAAVPGSKALQTTKQASHIIADIFVAKKAWAENNRDKIQKFYEGWMKAASELNESAAIRDAAARVMAEAVGQPVDFCLGAINNVRFTNHGDNLNFFGLNSAYKGVKGEDLYTGMGKRFEQLGFAKAGRATWRQVAWPAAAQLTKLSGPAHDAEDAPKFAAPKTTDQNLPELASKPVSISFASGKFQLDENAKTIIDLQFADVAKSYGQMRIRIEGNTDNVGKAAANKTLSLKRAQSVADYLATTYAMDRNRFIIVGNGPDSPVPGCEGNQDETCKAKNRRTEFQLIQSQ